MKDPNLDFYGKKAADTPAPTQTGEDQTNYNPDMQQKKFASQLEAARLIASQEYEGLSSRGSKGSGAHTHSSEGSGNVFKQQSDLIKATELRPTGSQAEGTGIQSSFQQKMQSMFGKQMQFQTASPLAKKGGFKMKRKK